MEKEWIDTAHRRVALKAATLLTNSLEGFMLGILLTKTHPEYAIRILNLIHEDMVEQIGDTPRFNQLIDLAERMPEIDPLEVMEV